jgi:hypothetical protein
MASLLPLRHVPLAAWRKCYIKFSSGRKGASPTFCAVHESSPGTKRTCGDDLLIVGFRGKADMARSRATR